MEWKVIIEYRRTSNLNWSEWTFTAIELDMQCVFEP